MTTVAIVNQHTNNYGDDAAGVALVNQAITTLNADHVDIFYIWHKGASGLPVDDGICSHHFLDDLSGRRDLRPQLAVGVIARALFRKVWRSDTRRLIEVCRKADAVFVSPAGSNIGIYKDWTYLFVLVSLVLEGIRPVFCQNTVGPSNSWIFNKVALFVLRRSSLFVREAASEKWLASHGLSAYLGVDTALLLPTSRATAPHEAPKTSREYVAVVPTRLSNWHRDFKGFDDQQLLRRVLPEAVAAVANARSLDVVLVPHLYGPEDESESLRQLAGTLGDLGCEVRVQDVGSLDDYRNALAAAQVVVSMRYHGLILAAQSGVPCVSLAYENKMLEAAHYLGVAELVIAVGSATDDVLRERLSLALDESIRLKKQMADRLDTTREVAMGPVLATKSRLLRS